MSSRVTRKRARTGTDEGTQDTKPDVSDPASAASGSAPAQANQPRRDEEFWFEDGTIILHAGDVEFRVYRGPLADHSPVFKDLFAQSHPTRTMSIDGRHDFPCPVVALSDSPYDLRHVLRAHMPRRDGSLYIVPTSPSFFAISASIRLGRKYNMTNLYQQALAFLKGFFSDDLDVWEKNRAWAPRGWDDEQVIGVINLSRLTGELSFLPAALMSCIINIGPDMMDGFTLEDGTQEHLTFDDLRLCFHAQSRLRAASIAAACRVVTPPTSPTCKLPRLCARVLHSVFQGERAESNIDGMMRGDILLFTPEYLTINDGKLTICEACRNVVIERDAKENRAIWNRLPGLLGINVPGWGQPVPAPAPGPAPA